MCDCIHPLNVMVKDDLLMVHSNQLEEHTKNHSYFK